MKVITESTDIRSIIDSRGERIVCEFCLRAYDAICCNKYDDERFYCPYCDKMFTPLVACDDDVQFIETDEDEGTGYCYVTPDKVRPFVRYRRNMGDRGEFVLKIHNPHS